MPYLTLPLAALLALAAPAAGSADTPAPAREIETQRAALPALASPVEIALDAVEIPSIRAATLEDAVCAEGWIHARERFLQMDLARREPAGELGQLVPQGVALDKEAAKLGLRAIAERAVARLPERHRRLLEAYAAGVNAQLAVVKPFEYQLLKVDCAPWTPTDSMLVQLSMARYLDGSDRLDRARTPIYRAFGDMVAGFLTSSRGALDMTVDGSQSPAAPAIPDAAALDLRASRAAAPKPAQAPAARPKSDEHPGSNAFAVAGSRTRDGRAVVGNDMHLALMAPNFWYRVDLAWPDGRLVGLSLPGVPAVVQGTNGHIAWGFTNLTADLSDLVAIERDAADPAKYRTAQGPRAFETRTVALGRGATRTELEVLGTSFGPVVATLADGRLLALRSPLVSDGSIDFGLFDMTDARTLEQALDCARRWKGPPQNVLVASSDGRIGWTISGSLPMRDRATPHIVDWRDAAAWKGTLPADAKPMVVDPPSGILTSANQLALAPSPALAGVLGLDEATGDRAFRMRELLAQRSDWTEADLHGVQLDVRSHRLLRWRDAILAALGAAPLPEASAKAREVLATWDGEVTATASAPVLLDGFRREMARDFGAWLAATDAGARGGLTAADATAAVDDEALLRTLESRPAHLVGRVEPAESGTTARADGAAPSWPDAACAWLARCEVAARAPARPSVQPDPAHPYATRGDRNRLAMRHPAADALGAAARFAEMPKAALPGHPTCVRVQTPGFGASERSVVSPAKLGDAILVTPGGQSGLPTSPHFRSLHAWWQDGKPYPLLPGETRKRIALEKDAPAAPAAKPPAAPTAPAVSPSS